MPDTPRTQAVALAMHEIYQEQYDGQTPWLQMEIAGALAGLAIDTGVAYNRDAGARKRLAHYLAPEITAEQRGIQRDAEIDPKTGLANGRALARALPRANGHPHTAVLMFDGDGFGQVNKRLGWTAGDAVINDLAMHVREVATEFTCGERVFRRAEGGDEFVILAPASKAEAILQAVEQGFGIRVYESVRVGVTGAIGHTDEEAQELLKRKKIDKRRKSLPRRLIKALTDENPYR